MHKASKAYLASATIVLLLAAGGIGWLFVEIGRSLPKTDPPDAALPTLVKNLPRQTVEIEPVFRQRVHAQYPDGMAASLLARDLRSKGFHLYSDHKNGLEFATLEQRGFPCVQDWVISWTPDARGLAQKIGAHYNLGCP